MKLRKKIKIKLSNLLLIIFLLIFMTPFLMIKHFNKEIKPKMIKIVEFQINKFSKDVIMEAFNKELLNQNELDEIIKITKNKNEEIIAVDFNIEKAYVISMALTKNIRQNLDKPSKKYFNSEYMQTYQDNSFLVFLPLGYGSQNNFWANLGPKIP